MSRRSRDVRLTSASRREATVRPDPVVRWARLALEIAMLLAGCRGGEVSGPVDPTSTIVSDPVAAVSLTCPGAAEAYVFLPPDSIPGGIAAAVQNRRTGRTIATAMINGGFDPVPVTAIAGDTLDIVVELSGGGNPERLIQPVPLKHAPSVVRTYPSSGKRDVPLNAGIVIVFSEPVAATTLSASAVQLYHGTSAVAGTVRLLEGSATAAVFTPSAPLDANTDYLLVVTQAVRDLQDDALAEVVTVLFATGTTTAGQASLVSVLPDTAAVLAGMQVQLTAVALAAGDDTMPKTPVPGAPVFWSTDDPAVATVCNTGLVTTHAAGVAHVRATVDQGGEPVFGTAVVLVSATLPPVESVELTPASAIVPARGRIQLTTVLKDGLGSVLSFRPVSWRTSDQSFATVEGTSGGKAWVTGVSAGGATITATSEGKSATAQINVVTPGPYATLTAAGGGSAGYTCGLTTDSWALCWGEDFAGQLGNGTSVSTSVPVPVAGGLRFSQVGGSYTTSCALTAAGEAYCWGDNVMGALGIGSTAGPEQCIYGPCSTTPVAAAGGLRFAAIDMGFSHGCALTQNGSAYCWGSNAQGELGIGTMTGPEECPAALQPGGPCSTVPVAVASGLTFTALTVGAGHTCALAAAGAAYCWGAAGALGDSTTLAHPSPVRVAGGLAFVALSAGGDHTCGLTSDGTAYCWGANYSGQLGDGTNTTSTAPVPVAGGLKWASISAGAAHTCAVTPSGSAYCWGYNGFGTLGDGTTTYRSTPSPVAGGLVFASVTAGGEHTCGVTVARIAYCWGNNQSGALGNGTTTQEPVTAPVKVAGQP